VVGFWPVPFMSNRAEGKIKKVTICYLGVRGGWGWVVVPTR